MAMFVASAKIVIKHYGYFSDSERDRVRDQWGACDMGLKALVSAQNEFESLVKQTDPKRN